MLEKNTKNYMNREGDERKDHKRYNNEAFLNYLLLWHDRLHQTNFRFTNKMTRTKMMGKCKQKYQDTSP